MFTDERVFDVGVVPDRELFVHRSGELTALASALDSVVSEGVVTQHVRLFGPSGSGKTAAARLGLQQLRETDADVRTQYVNCWDHSEPSAVLYQLCDGLGVAGDLRPGTTPHVEFRRRIRERDETPYVVVLDEVDQLGDEDLLYFLWQQPHVCLVHVCNCEQDFFESLGPRATSRFRGSERIRFAAYDDTTLVDILRERANAGLQRFTTSTGVLEEIAAAASGDARAAIMHLHAAATTARRENASGVSSEHVDAAEPVARERLRERTISQFSRHQRLLYEQLPDDGSPAQMGELYPAYVEAVDEGDAKSKQTIRRYLRKLAEYELVDIEGKRGGRRYRRDSVEQPVDAEAR